VKIKFSAVLRSLCLQSAQSHLRPSQSRFYSFSQTKFIISLKFLSGFFFEPKQKEIFSFLSDTKFLRAAVSKDSLTAQIFFIYFFRRKAIQRFTLKQENSNLFSPNFPSRQRNQKTIKANFA